MSEHSLSINSRKYLEGGERLRNSNSHKVPEICPNIPLPPTAAPAPAWAKPIFHRFKIHFYCTDPPPSAAAFSGCQASGTGIAAWGSLIGGRALAQPTSAAGFGDNKSGLGVSAWRAAKGLSLPIEPRNGRQQGGRGQRRRAEAVRERKTTGMYLQPATSRHLDSQLSKKQAGPRHTGQTANTFLPAPSSDLSGTAQKYQILKQGHECRSSCFPEMRGSHPSPKGISELPELVVVLRSPNTPCKHVCRSVYNDRIGCSAPSAGFLQGPVALTAQSSPWLKNPGGTETSAGRWS